MAAVEVLIAVDVTGALSSGNLNNNIYMMDTHGYLGSTGEGTNELQTRVTNAEIITWSVRPIDPATNVTVQSWGGNAVTGGNITPAFDQTTNSWSAQFMPTPPYTAGQSYQYNATLQFNGGETLQFDPFLITV
jgi:hypothetical protein